MAHLVGIHGIYGDLVHEQQDPPVVEVNDATYMPLQRGVWYDFDQSWGIYKDGRLVKEAAYTRGPGETLVGQSHTIISPSADEAPEDVYIYAGPINTHFGHFLLSSLERFWHPDRSAKFLVHGPISPEEWFSIPFVAQIFSTLGIVAENFERFEKPTHIRKLIVPGASFRENHSASDTYNKLCNFVGDKISCGEYSQLQRGPPVYLSKERLAGGVWHIVNESDLATQLSNRGVEILYPEQLSLRDQVKTFKERTVIGTVSSGLHVSALSSTPSRLVALTRDDAISSNFLLIDTMKNNSSGYIAPDPKFDFLGPTNSFLETCRIHRPDLVAESLLRLCEIV